MSIDKQNFWGSNYYNHPPLTDDALSKAEFELKARLPLLFIDLLKIQNGGYTKGFVFPMNQKTSWAEDHVPLSDLSGIVLDNGVKTPQNIMLSAYMTAEWGLPEKQILLTGDGHWWITLDYRDAKDPVVRWMDVECNEEVLIARSFDEFIAGLVSEDKFFP